MFTIKNLVDVVFTVISIIVITLLTKQYVDDKNQEKKIKRSKRINNES